MNDQTRSHPRALVVFREVERVDGQSAGVVYCPRRNRTAAVSECRQCEHCQGVCIDMGDDGAAFVRCAWLHDRVAPRAGVGPAASLATVMSSPVPCVSPEDTLERAHALLSAHPLAALPVVDGDGKAIGMVTRPDVLQALESGATAAAAMPLSKVMSPLVFALHADADLSRAAAVMAYEGVHHVVVAGADGRPAGVVSSLDILRWLARDHGYVMPEKE